MRLLIASYMKFKDEFGKSQQSKKKIFEKIAQEFNLHSDLFVTADQCSRKWKKLEGKQKEVEDNNSKTGRPTKTWKFYEEMQECVGKNPNIKLLFIYEASSASSSMSGSSSLVHDDLSSASDNEDNEGEGTTSKKANSKQKRLSRKRKSRSSAAEMIEFLKDYSTKREKIEEEKINLLKSMQEEKKQFFSDLFSYLKDSKK